MCVCVWYVANIAVGIQQANGADCRSQYTPKCLKSSECSRSSWWIKKIILTPFLASILTFKKQCPTVQQYTSFSFRKLKHFHSFQHPSHSVLTAPQPARSLPPPLDTPLHSHYVQTHGSLLSISPNTTDTRWNVGASLWYALMHIKYSGNCAALHSRDVQTRHVPDRSMIDHQPFRAFDRGYPSTEHVLRTHHRKSSVLWIRWQCYAYYLEPNT